MSKRDELKKEYYQKYGVFNGKYLDHSVKWLEDQILSLRSKNVCDVCGSDDVIDAPHMGKNCNRCHPL